MERIRGKKKEKVSKATPHRIVGDNIRRERINRDFTIEELAELAGMSASHLGLVERGSRGLSLDKLFSVATVFNMDAANLLRFSGYSFVEFNTSDDRAALSEEPVVYVVNRQNYDAVMSLISKMGEEELGFLIGVIKSLKVLIKNIT